MRTPSIVLLVTLSAAAAGCSSHRSPTPHAGPVTLAFVNVRIFDGERVNPRGVVLVDGDRIVAVGADVVAPAGAQVVDGAGKTLLPGLIDAHSHVHSLAALEQTLAYGVTTTLDMFGDPTDGAELKRGITDRHADLRVAGFGATPPGGHGTEYGMPVPTLTRPDEAAAWVDARVAEGSDYIKIIYDDGAVYGLHMPTLDEPTIEAIVKQAHARGKLAVAHIGSLSDARGAIAAGVDGLAHLFLAPSPDAEFGRFAAAHGVFVVPTLGVLHSLCDDGHGARLATDPRIAPALSAEALASLSERFPVPKVKLACDAPDATIQQLLAAGVPILTGTDAPNPGTTHGATLHEELELLVAAGLTPEQALTAATAAPAKAFGLADRGRIAPGLRADLVLVEGDPTKDVLDTRAIVGVWKGGHAFDRPAYFASLAAERDEAADAAKEGAAALADGRISNFDDGTTSSRFGSGWELSTDLIASGKSTGTMSVVDGGAAGSARALQVTGTIDGGLPFAWAGAMFHPGSRALAPTDLSSKKRIHFWARGDAGASYRLKFFCTSGGPRPYSTTFTAGPVWSEHDVDLSTIPGLTLDDVRMIQWAGGPAPGPFTLAIDEVSLGD